MKMKIVTYDAEDQPPWHDINVALLGMDNAKIFDVHTEGDHLALVIAPMAATPAQAQVFYNTHRFDE